MEIQLQWHHQYFPTYLPRNTHTITEIMFMAHDNIVNYLFSLLILVQNVNRYLIGASPSISYSSFWLVPIAYFILCCSYSDMFVYAIKR